MRSFVIAAAILLWSSPLQAKLACSDLLLKHVDGAILLDLDHGTMTADLLLTLDKSVRAPNTICFSLYRLLDVTSIQDVKGQRLQFESRIVRHADEPAIQVLLTQVRASAPLAQFRVQYAGSILGYSEAWAYVKDRISPDYSLLRDDSWAFPQMGFPSRSSYARVFETKYTYRLDVAVPRGYTVAMGGRIESQAETGDRITYKYSSKVPVWRLDLAVAKFVSLADPGGRFHVFALSGDEEGGQRVLTAMQQCIPLYTEWFGARSDFQGYTAIEIPADWGSQAADLYFMQTAAAFKSNEAISEAYHEIAHNWNPRPTRALRQSRFFDEAFASYFAALAKRQLQGEDAYQAELESSRKSVARRFRRTASLADVPITEFGAKGIGYLSYTKGALALYVLHKHVGDERFRQIVRDLLALPETDFESVRRIVQERSGKDGDVFLNDWIFGTTSRGLIMSDKPVTSW